MRLSPEPAADTPVPGHGRRAVFIDKDGTLVENVPYNVDPALLRFTPHAAEGLRRLADAGFLLIVVSNQPGLALGLFDLPALQRLERALTAQLALDGVHLDGFYACPHAPVAVGDASAASPPPPLGAVSPGSALSRLAAQRCACRKPAPGLLLEAVWGHSIDLAGSWIIGDILDDIEAGSRAGCRSVHLDVGNETVWHRSLLRTPTHTATDLLAAAEAILASPPPPESPDRGRRSAAANAGAR